MIKRFYCLATLILFFFAAANAQSSLDGTYAEIGSDHCSPVTEGVWVPQCVKWGPMQPAITIEVKTDSVAGQPRVCINFLGNPDKDYMSNCYQSGILTNGDKSDGSVVTDQNTLVVSSSEINFIDLETVTWYTKDGKPSKISRYTHTVKFSYDKTKKSGSLVQADTDETYGKHYKETYHVR